MTTRSHTTNETINHPKCDATHFDILAAEKIRTNILQWLRKNLSEWLERQVANSQCKHDYVRGKKSATNAMKLCSGHRLCGVRVHDKSATAVETREKKMKRASQLHKQFSKI